MELKYVEEFLALAQEKNYREVAEQLGLSSSALTKHIKLLEAELGYSLFSRTTRKVELTPHGEVFAAYAERGAELIKECGNALRKCQQSGADRLSIGTISLSAIEPITAAIAQYRVENPSCAIELSEAKPESRLRYRLRTGRYDMIFTRESDESDADFQKVIYAQEQLAVICPASHPLASREKVSLAQLRHEDFIFPARGTQLYEICLTLCRNAGFEPNIVLTDSSFANRAELVKEGMGIALAMTSASSPADAFGNPFALIEPPVSSQLLALYPRDPEKVSPAALRLLQFLQRRA